MPDYILEFQEGFNLTSDPVPSWKFTSRNDDTAACEVYRHLKINGLLTVKSFFNHGGKALFRQEGESRVRIFPLQVTVKFTYGKTNRVACSRFIKWLEVNDCECDESKGVLSIFFTPV